MSKVKLKDFDIERYILAACLKGPSYWKNFPVDWLNEEISRKVYKEFRKFVEYPYLTYPTFDLIIDKVEDVDIKLFVQELKSIDVDRRELPVKMQDLFEMFANRKVLEIAQSIPNDLESKKVGDIVRSKITQLSELMNPFSVGQRVRGFIYEDAKNRWSTYKAIEKDPSLLGGIPYHISQLDLLTNGGLRKGHIVLFFAESGGYKTRVKANLAYNFSFLEKKDVMVLTLEVPKEDYSRIIDSRHAKLNYNEIVAAKLSPEAKERYKNSLKNILEERPPLYIVDIPDEATSADIVKELELYYAKQGKYPDIVILDYLNEMSPISSWNNTSEKFKNLGVEIRRITRSYNIGFITSMQENREGKKMKQKEKVGTEHIGESHYFQNVCHLVIHLYQDSEGVDELSNVLHFGIKKNRYGKKDSFEVFVNPEQNYIGDFKLI